MYRNKDFFFQNVFFFLVRSGTSGTTLVFVHCGAFHNL
jgi:hypothetical protein